jgi:hypothetical protein
MGKVVTIKTNFTAGEISPELLGRGDLRAYENGMLALRNMFIDPTGGVRRRAGTVHIASFASYARLISYEVSVDQTFLLAVMNGTTQIFLNGVLQTTLTTPWTTAQLDQLNWGQTADALLVVHPDVAPKRITRSAAGVWAIADWSWAQGGNLLLQPYARFAPPEVTLFSSQTSGTATITASAAIFSTDYIGIRLRIRNTECTITGYTNPVTVTATVHGVLSATPATNDWYEQAFSPLRGYPITAAFHQDRLVLGGSRALPNRLWLSRTGDYFNFDLGTGLDDQAIEFGIVSDQINAIRAVVSGRHLQVFTSGAEYMVTGDPLTPTHVQVKRQTRIGSAVDRSIPPMDIDGATLFVARSRNEIREFLYTDIEQAYQATDVALLTRAMIKSAVDQDYDKNRRLLFVVREDGLFATLTMFRPEQIAAWTLHDTQGTVKAVAVVGDRVYLQVLRAGSHRLEEVVDDVLLDAAVVAGAGSPQTVWSGLGHLEGLTVKVVGDGIPQPDRVVSGGAITIATAASQVRIGLGYTHIMTPLPQNMLAAPGDHRKVRLLRLAVRLHQTQALRLDHGRGLRAIPLPSGGPPQVYSGDVSVMGYGWRTHLDDPLWGIQGDDPVPLQILSITTATQVN